jgi:hypothetical protein
MARLLKIDTASIRGSVGGTTYSRDKWNAITARVRRYPTKKRTAAQSFIRLGLSSASAAWNRLSESDRLHWNEFSVLTFAPYFASYKFLKGRLAFIRQYCIVDRINRKVISGQPPLPQTTIAPPTEQPLASVNFIPVPPNPGTTGIRFVRAIPLLEDVVVYGLLSLPLRSQFSPFPRDLHSKTFTHRLWTVAGTQGLPFSGLLPDRWYAVLLCCVSVSLDNRRIGLERRFIVKSTSVV